MQHSDFPRKLVVVLGMHRSGTSAIARGLQLLGVELGDHLMPPIENNNEKGFWEDIDINEFNIEAMAEIGSDWHHLTPLSAADVERLCDGGFQERATELIRRKADGSRIFGFKDPRVAKLLPFWKRVFAELDMEVSYVLAIRNPLSVARSLARRDKFSAEKSHLLWLDHLIASLAGSRGCPCHVVDYDLLLQFPEQELARAARFLQCEIPAAQLHAIGQEFLDSDLRHNYFDVAQLSEDKASPFLVKEIYTALLEAATDRVELKDADFDVRLQGWTLEYNKLYPCLVLADTLFSRQIELEKELGDSRYEANSLCQTVTERDTQIEGLSNRVTEQDRHIVKLDQQILKLNEVVIERDQHVARLYDAIHEIRASTSWRVTAPLRYVSAKVKNAIRAYRILRHALHKTGGAMPAARKVLRALRNGGVSGLRMHIGRLVHQSDQGTGDASDHISPESGLSIVPCYIDPKLDETEREPATRPSVAIHLHLYYVDMLAEVAAYLRAMPCTFDLYVSIPETVESAPVMDQLRVLVPRAEKIIIETVPNRGRDIAPLIIQFGRRLLQYDVIAHIHTKKSLHNSFLKSWCKDLLDLLFGPPGSQSGRIAYIIDLLQTTAKIVYPEGRFQFIKDPTGWSDNHALARGLLEKYSTLSIEDFPLIDFPEGAMFWARTDCLHEFLSLPLSFSDFSAEPIPPDGTLAHALERLLLVFASEHEGQCVRIHAGDSIRDYRYYEDQVDFAAAVARSDIKILSYYLPQFHPIPENDQWHGKGFTEWTKVRAATPLFEGHYQQHIPHADIGYYLLDSAETLRQQAEMMGKAGVHGQIFYHYWFSGKLILDEPARMLLETPDIQMPFCFCWANENWTRRWDGNENEVLLGQEYSPLDARAFIRHLIPFFIDPRYIRLDDRPVLFVYRPASLPTSGDYLDIWEKECADHGLKRPYIVAVLTRGATHPRDFGMDAGVERPLHDWAAGAVPELKNSLHTYQPMRGSVLAYAKVAEFYAGQSAKKDFTYFRSVLPNWDNTARYGGDAYLLHGSTPELFQAWLESAIAHSRANLPEDRRFVVVNAWNEWAEGTHLEPDTRYGYSYLNAIGRSLSGHPVAADLNAELPVPADLRVHLDIPDVIVRQLNADPFLKTRFMAGLLKSSIFGLCHVSHAAPDVLPPVGTTKKCLADETADADYILTFRRASLFDPYTIEKMIRTALLLPGSVILSNAYDRNAPLVEITSNGSVHASAAYAAPLVLQHVGTVRHGYRNFRMRTDAHSFVTYPNARQLEDLPVVTTIIRFHHSADLAILKNALHCLLAMQECVVVPLIAAQDLNEQQQFTLQLLLSEHEWVAGREPIVDYYHSGQGKGDLRSKMLNESLKKVATRYAAFLDYDDLLMSHAYDWLIGRMCQTGKAVAFGRVYSTSYDSANGVILERKRTYEYGYTFDDFLRYNHAPLHSFMLDMEQLDVSNLTYFEDQRYMEDYLLTLQLFTRENADWEGLAENIYIGDYIHSVDRTHTLAFSDTQEREKIFMDPEYILSEQRICDMRARQAG